MNAIQGKAAIYGFGLLSMVSSANASEFLTVDSQTIQGTDVIARYSLPQSSLKITLPITRVRYVPGVLANYSGQYSLPTRLNDAVFLNFGKACVKGVDQSVDVYLLGSPKIDVVLVPDPTRQYAVTSPHSVSERERIALKAALPKKLSGTATPVGFAFTAEPVEIPAPTKADAASDLALATSLEAAKGVTANVVVNRLRVLRDNREKLLTNTQLSGQQLSEALSAIQREIESLSIRFSGNVQVERYVFSLEWAPAASDSDGKQVVKSLFKLDACHGLRDLADGYSLDGISPDALAASQKTAPVSVQDIHIVASIPSASQPSKEITVTSQVKYGLRYRLPYTSNVILYDGGDEIARASISLPQLGDVLDMTPQLRMGQDGKFGFYIEETTGGLVTAQ